jgi:GNAT superfamily N-acetyltransferase
MNIRPAALEDAAAISELIGNLTHFYTAHPNARGAEEFFAMLTPEAIRSYILAPNYSYFVGHIGKELVGVSSIRDNKHLFHFFVAKKFHNMGYGKQLWRTAMKDALQKGNPGEFTVNSSLYALPIYRSFGFLPEDGESELMGVAYVPMRAVGLRLETACTQ